MERVAESVLANTALLIEELPRIDGIRITSRTEAKRRSGIVSFEHQRVSPEVIYKGLLAKGVSCAVRGRSVRLSPHFYQGEKELQAFLDLLAQIV